MPKTIFVNGSVVSASFLNAINNAIFKSNPSNDGELPLITNNDLSSNAGQLKPEWESFRDTFKVSSASGLTINYQAGTVTLPSGQISVIAAGSLLLNNNQTNYIFINELGSVASSLIQPQFGLPLAIVTTISGAITNIIDVRPRFNIAPITSSIKIFGGNGDQGDYSLTNTATLGEGYYYYRNFTIQAGATLTISRFAKIFCSGTANISGSIVVTQLASAGNMVRSNLVGTFGGITGSGPGAGNAATGGNSYNYAATPFGSGGGTGFMNLAASSTGELAGGGRGGGGLWIEARGQVTCSGSISCVGENGKSGQLVAGTGDISGGGGGSGGLILLSSLDSVVVSPTAVLDLRGGRGGDAISGSALGGGGGSGGQAVLISPSNNVSGATILLAGGAFGTGIGGNGLGAGGGGGFGGNGGGGGVGRLAAENGALVLRNFRAVGS
jgi:hypothetical protein